MSEDIVQRLRREVPRRGDIGLQQLAAAEIERERERGSGGAKGSRSHNQAEAVGGTDAAADATTTSQRPTRS